MSLEEFRTSFAVKAVGELIKFALLTEFFYVAFHFISKFW